MTRYGNDAGAIVVLADPKPNGLAEMLAGLLDSNLARDPGRARLLHRAIVSLEALDAGVVVTLSLLPGRVRVANGAAEGRWDLRIRANAQDLLELSIAPLRFGLPDPLRRGGRSVLGGILARRVRISGMLRHPVVLARFARLLSVA